MDKKVLYKLSYGIYAIGVMDEDTPQGCIVNTVFQVSSDDMIALSMSKNNYTHGLIEKTGYFSAAVITEDTPPLTIGKLGFYTGAKAKKYEGLQYDMIDGLPVLKDHTAGYLLCKVKGSYDTGSHTVYFAQVVNAEQGEDLPVMTYEYYHKVVKGKAPKNAPTYQG
ncbi:flavin reductase family protein [Christensenellaceae bacterium OttesenSCG-928-M15]|nr:flavin reductase family protein [Christensenellaceae bacterium OttesenSCG-928-M15]